MSTHDKKAMVSFFSRAGIALDTIQSERFWSFYKLLERYTRELDLSRLTNFSDIIVKHFIDSAHVGTLCDIPSPLLDIGTGAGFPGVPLKIMDPGLEVVLAEPRHRRVAFLERLIGELGLTGITIYPHLVTGHSFFNVNAVITRALETAEETAARVHHFLPRAGRIILMKGPAAEREVRELSREIRDNYSIAADREYTLPGTSYRRRLIVLEKISAVRTHTYRILTKGEAPMGTVISSSENRTFREIKKLVTIDGIRKAGKAILSGRKQVLEAGALRRGLCDFMVIYDGYAESDDELNALAVEFAASGKLLLMKKSLFNEIDAFTTGGPLMVIRTPVLPEWDPLTAEGCTLLIPFQDPRNVGALIRTAAAFGVGRIVLLREAAHPFHPKSLRASGGAVFTAPIMRGPSIGDIEDLCRTHALELIALDAAGTPLPGFPFPRRFLLLPGLEGPGLPESLRSRAVSVPISGEVESLNAVVAASIALYEYRRGARGGAGMLTENGGGG
jgi:16S rRNA (guanine527-N7)-methyltransferase